ncbi:hypothetical protein [Streptomyces halstedii]|uniref:Uncharacterized protein n=1 Tax=Streptomyces halstedii TaxID=1944 RepID=A0A6N9U8N0_STRHA|nr:hypothetical protein [Streptomyces halstedii]NEA20181.1 hypothetical protein [Streptomyces halstedii]
MTFDEMLAAALRPIPDCRSVQIKDEDGLHVMLYRHAEDGQHTESALRGWPVQGAGAGS